MMLAGSTLGLGLALFVTAVSLLLGVRAQLVAVWGLSVFLGVGLLGWFAEVLLGPAIRSVMERPDSEEEAAELSRRFPGGAAVLPEALLRGQSLDVTIPAEMGQGTTPAPAATTAAAPAVAAAPPAPSSEIPAPAPAEPAEAAAEEGAESPAPAGPPAGEFIPMPPQEAGSLPAAAERAGANLT